MSYDGGLTVKIKNKKLGEVLDDFAERGYFQEESVQSWRDRPEEDDWGEIINPRVKYTLFYSYLDCAYVEGCPSNINELGRFITELIKVYEEDSIQYNQLSEIQNRIEQQDVVKDYKYVSWQYYVPDSDEMEEFTYRK